MITYSCKYLDIILQYQILMPTPYKIIPFVGYYKLIPRGKNS